MPFVKSAYLNKEGTARPANNAVEGIVHFGAVRMRLTGTGSLLMSVYDLNDVNTSALVPFTMANVTPIEPTRLMNFNTQRMALRISTTVINEYFRINRIIMFAKDIYTSYPGTS